jgi:hypothetical protein
MRTHLFLAIASLALLVALAPLADAEEVQVGRIKLTLPEGWKPEPIPEGKQAQFLNIIPAGHEKTARLQLFPPIRLEDDVLPKLVRVTIKACDEGRKILQRVPLERGGWFNAECGLPINAAAQKSVDAQGNERMAVVWGVAAGDYFHRILLLATDPKSLPQLLGAVQTALLKLSYEFPLDGGVKPLPGTPTRASLLQATYVIPHGISLDAQTNVSDVLWHRSVVFSEKASRAIPFRIRLHSGNPSNARRLLVHWLLATDWGIKPTKGSTYKVQTYNDFRCEGSLPITMVILQVNKGERPVDKRLGFLVHGRGWSVMIGVAHDLAPYSYAKPEWEQQFAGELKLSLTRAYTIASSVRLPVVALKPRPDVDQFLAQKKEHRWRYEMTYSSGATSTYLEKYVNWTFFPDRSCTVERNSFLGSSSLAADPSTGVPTIGGMSTLTYEKGKEPSGKGHYMAFQWQNGLYLLVTPPSGLNSIHSLELQAKGSFGDSKDFVGVAIDGRIEGKYSTGNDFKFREAPSGGPQKPGPQKPGPQKPGPQKPGPQKPGPQKPGK